MKKILALAIAFLIILAACGNHSNHEHHSHEGKLKVVTTNSILYDMVKRVGGNKVDKIHMNMRLNLKILKH